ncbi:MAG TPA: deoxyribodipyrimidine photo-lyase [Jiangellaceae bacterium]|nr:deoxyribodipyrimidine photo-lyase [Jiangellaceae bacterium]
MTAVVLFTRDLRVHDHPALAGACRDHAEVVPLFVVDDRILRAPTASPNRAAFLTDSLADLRSALHDRGGDLVIRRGDVVAEAIRVARQVGADEIRVSADVSGYAQLRQRRLVAAGDRAGVTVELTPGVTVVEPGALVPGGGDHYRVFTPYFRAWRATSWRSAETVPRAVRLPTGVRVGKLPTADDLVPGDRSPRLPTGGESAGRRLLEAVLRRVARGEPDLDDLSGDHTSRLSPYLHMGCVSPLAAARRLADRAPGMLRQLAWRDFLHQVTAAFPAIATADYRPRANAWRYDDDAFDAWRRGRTGIPIVDAGMRQLLAEGWMHNRARLITASFLSKTLRLDWRSGAAHFFRWLVDGDIANNAGNWQWVAGTGNDTRPNRVLNPIRQAHRFDPDGHYVRRYVPELSDVQGGAVHEPWRLHPADRARLDYPPPLVEPRSGPNQPARWPVEES